MNYIKIGVDLDGVVADFSYKFSTVLRKLYGDHLPLVTKESKVSHWEWDMWYPELNREQYMKAWEHVCNNEYGFWEDIPLVDEPEWKNFLTLNEYANLDVYFITARAKVPGKSVAQQSQLWLDRNGWINPQVIVTTEKEHFIKMLNIKYFIDDRKENCESVKLYNPNCNVYVYDALHNRGLEDFKLGIKRVHTLGEFVTDIKLNLKE